MKTKIVEKLQLSPKNFYLLGIYSFLIISACNLASLGIHIKTMEAWAIIQTIVFTIFYLGTALLFKYFLNMLPKETVEHASDDIDRIIKEIEEKRDKKEVKKK